MDMEIKSKVSEIGYDRVKNIQYESFEDNVLKKKGLVLVDFWYVWCPPCVMRKPVLDSLAKEFAGKARICRFDIETNQVIADNYSNRYVPTIVFFKDGLVVDRMFGHQPKDEIAARIEMNL